MEQLQRGHRTLVRSPYVRAGGRFASLIRAYDLQFVNGLLQIPEYSRAVIASNRSLGSAEVKKLVEMRQRRQQKFADPVNSPKLWVVLDESAWRCAARSGDPR